MHFFLLAQAAATHAATTAQGQQPQGSVLTTFVPFIFMR